MMKSPTPIPRFTHHFGVPKAPRCRRATSAQLFGADPLHRNLVAERASRAARRSRRATPASRSPAPTSRSARCIVANAPDGAIYVADFYEEFIAHGQNYQGQIDPTTGRIYRLRGQELQLNEGREPRRENERAARRTLRHPNRWHRQTAVRLLGERRDPSAIEPLRQLLRKTETHPALEALWALHQAGWLDEATIAGRSRTRQLRCARGPFGCWATPERCPRGLPHAPRASLRPSRTRRCDRRSPRPPPASDRASARAGGGRSAARRGRR